MYNQATNTYIQVTINDKDVCPRYEDFIKFKMTEYSGLAIPEFEIAYKTFDESLADLANINNTCKVTFGDSPSNTVSYEFYIMDAQKDKSTQGVCSVYLLGLGVNPKFIKDKGTECYVGTSIDVIKQFYNAYLRNNTTQEIDSDIVSPSDETVQANEEQQKLNDNIENLDKEIATLEGDIEKIQEEVDKANEKLGGLETDITSLEDSIDIENQKLYNDDDGTGLYTNLEGYNAIIQSSKDAYTNQAQSIDIDNHLKYTTDSNGKRIYETNADGSPVYEKDGTGHDYPSFEDIENYRANITCDIVDGVVILNRNAEATALYNAHPSLSNLDTSMKTQYEAQCNANDTQNEIDLIETNIASLQSSLFRKQNEQQTQQSLWLNKSDENRAKMEELANKQEDITKKRTELSKLRKQATKDRLSGKQREYSYTPVNEEPMVWQREGKTANIFMADVWAHMNIQPSFPLMAIDKDGNLIIRDCDKLKKTQPKWRFINNERMSNYMAGDILFFNTFTVTPYKDMSNLIAGYGRVANVRNIDTGKYNVELNESTESIISNSIITETNDYGTSIAQAYVNSGNVRSDYQQTYLHNTAKFLDVSSYEGCVVLTGKLYKEFKPLDLVYVNAGSTYKSVEGKYLIDTIEYVIEANQDLITNVWVARDNLNGLENHVDMAKVKQRLIIPTGTKRKTLETLRNLRAVVSLLRSVANGQFLNEIESFVKVLKYNLLSNFIGYKNANLNLNSKGELLNSLLVMANRIANDIIDNVLPAPYNRLFHDIVLYRPKDIKRAVYKIYSIAIPYEIQEALSEVLSLVAETSSLLQYIRQKNNIEKTQQEISYERHKAGMQVKTVETQEDGTTTIIETRDDMDNEHRVQEILDNVISTIEDKTNGADVPIPVPALTDSEKLLNEEQIRNLVVDKIEQNLKDSGYADYLTDADWNGGIDEYGNDQKGLDQVLRSPNSTDQLPISIVMKLKKGAGNKMYTRFWGSFNAYAELTNYFIEDSYKELFKTMGTTKLINATGGKRVFFAVPANKVTRKLRFYINNTNVTNKIGVDVDTEEHPILETVLNVADSNGLKVKYRVFYTNERYNSNSVIFEIREI